MRISAVSYLNTKPFIYGLYRSGLAGHFDLSLDIPSVCASKLLNNEADLALAPVAIIPELDNAHLVSNYCIGSKGPVRSVCIFSDCPIESVEFIYLDFHSRTSVALTRLLCQHYWRISPVFLPAPQGFEDKIMGNTAGLIIGDRSFAYLGKHAYTYDLAEIWTAWKGLPFVFAAWVSNKPLPLDWLQPFNDALAFGLGHLDELCRIMPTLPGIDLETYYRENISYELDQAKWLALNQFLNYISGENGFQLRKVFPARQ
jgi:chorismate dehydratase